MLWRLREVVRDRAVRKCNVTCDVYRKPARRLQGNLRTCRFGGWKHRLVLSFSLWKILQGRSKISNSFFFLKLSLFLMWRNWFWLGCESWGIAGNRIVRGTNTGPLLWKWNSQNLLLPSLPFEKQTFRYSWTYLFHGIQLSLLSCLPISPNPKQGKSACVRGAFKGQ